LKEIIKEESIFIIDNYIVHKESNIEENLLNNNSSQEKSNEEFKIMSIIENGKEMGTIDGALADTICPKGWHIPTREEWEELEKAMKVDGENGHDVANRMKHSDSVYFLMSSNPEYYPNVMLAGSDDCSMAVMSSGYLYGEKKADEIGASFLSSSQESVNFFIDISSWTGDWFLDTTL